MSDILANYTPQEVAQFYRRLANLINMTKGKGVEDSLAAKLMNLWLDNRDPTATIAVKAPIHLINNKYVKNVLKDHRAYYLTEKKGKEGRWVGIIPRLRDKRWDGKKLLNLTYQSLVDIPIRSQYLGSDGDIDLLYALHGFQLKSEVMVIMTPSYDPANAIEYSIVFLHMGATAIDRYDWDATKHISVPNPDHKSKEPYAIEPDSDKISVYHSNAKRVEVAGLAAPYNLTISWMVADLDITRTAKINPKKRLF